MIAAPSQGTLQRLPQYLIMLKTEQREGRNTVSAESIGEVVRVSSSQVRHDLSACGISRGPGEAYDVPELMACIEHTLGYDDVMNAVIVGAGLAGKEIGGKPILSVKRMTGLCRRMKVQIGIITVPADHAQEACDRLVEGGIQAIWNFAPVHLRVPDDVLVKNEIIAVSLGDLSRQLQEKRRSE